MFGLKIFVRVQTFRRVPPVLPCNFCHPEAIKDPSKGGRCSMLSIWGSFCHLWCFQASRTRVWKYQIMVLANVKWISFSLTMCETGLEWKLTKGPGAPSLYFQVIRHEKINRVSARCNPLPDYNFTSCLIESKAKKVNCTMPWSFQIEGK